MNTISSAVELENQLRKQSLAGEDVYQSHKKVVEIPQERLIEAASLFGKSTAEVVGEFVTLDDSKRTYVTNKVEKTLLDSCTQGKSIGGVTK